MYVWKPQSQAAAQAEPGQWGELRGNARGGGVRCRERRQTVVIRGRMLGGPMEIPNGGWRAIGGKSEGRSGRRGRVLVYQPRHGGAEEEGR